MMLASGTGACAVRRPSKGYTIVELMTVVAIIAITLTIGLPSFLDVIRTSQMSTRTNDFIAAVALARSEATRRNRTAEICARASDTACATTGGAAAWTQGWIVWADADEDSTLDAPGEIVRIGSPQPNIAVTGGDLLRINFDRRGLATNLRNATLVNRQLAMSHSACAPGKPLRRGVEFSTLGRLTATKENCT
jgi:type IV fimbrial biogenesis protein FimT